MVKKGNEVAILSGSTKHMSRANIQTIGLQGDYDHYVANVFELCYTQAHSTSKEANAHSYTHKANATQFKRDIANSTKVVHA